MDDIWTGIWTYNQQDCSCYNFPYQCLHSKLVTLEGYETHKSLSMRLYSGLHFNTSVLHLEIFVSFTD